MIIFISIDITSTNAVPLGYLEQNNGKCHSNAENRVVPNSAAKRTKCFTRVRHKQ